MSFLHLFLILSVLIFPLCSVAEVTVRGKVLDKDTQEPLPFCAVQLKGTSWGCISNEDGDFELTVRSTSDSISFSYMSYDPATVSVGVLEANSTVFMKKAQHQLKEFMVHGDKDFLYALLVKCRERNRALVKQESRAYFSLQTQAGDQPLEAIECYYSAHIGGNSLQRLVLKSGKVGMAPLEGAYFVSLNTTDILVLYKLFEASESNLPKNPLMLKKHPMKTAYDVELLSVSGPADNLYEIQFTPKLDAGAYFSGVVWMDKNSGNILKLELTQDQLANHPFRPIRQTDKVGILDIELSYTFETDSIFTRLQNIDFNYSFDYSSKVGQKRLHTNGVVYLYDYDSVFVKPRFNYDASYSDYQKIVAFPHNEKFWSYTDALLPSEQKQAFVRFFKEHGTLINFDKLSHASTLLHSKKLRWDRARLDINMIEGERGYNVRPSRINFYNYRARYVPRKGFFGDVEDSQFYYLKGQLFLDMNFENGDADHLSAAMLDLDQCFYYLMPEKYSTCFVNIFFDLIEIQRRKLEKALAEAKPNEKRYAFLYQKFQDELEIILRTYINEVRKGANAEALIQWSNMVNDELGINNLILIDDSVDEMRLKKALSQTGNMQELDYYNLGSAYLKLGEFEVAVEHLSKAERLGMQHPWLYYNLAIAYHAVGNAEKACEYMNMSGERGEMIEIEVFEQLCGDD
jgi:hypothetical protein